MNKYIFYIVAIVILFCSNIKIVLSQEFDVRDYRTVNNYKTISDSANSFFEGTYQTTESGDYARYQRWDMFWKFRNSEYNSQNPGDFAPIMNAYKALYNQSFPQNSTESNWQLLGPKKNLSNSDGDLGIIVSIAGHPTNQNIVYVGSNSSGLWKTENFLDPIPNWSCITDVLNIPLLGVNDVQVDPNNPQTMYIATGTVAGNSGGIGLGILRSDDGGQTWSLKNPIGLSDRSLSRRIAINSVNSNVVYALIDDKLYKSTNKGDSWNVIFTLPNSVGDNPCNPNGSARFLVDIELKPGDPSTIYISSDYAECALANHPNSGALIYKSTDAGINFNILQPEGTSTQTTMTKLAVSEDEPNSLFVVYDQKLFKSSDSGNNWNLINSNLSIGGLGFWMSEVEVSPADASRIYICGLYVHASDDGGNSFSITNSGHVDARRLFIPYADADVDKIILGNDGGVMYTVDKGNPWACKNGVGLAITQYYGIGVSEKHHIAGGSQDNDVSFNDGRNWKLPTLVQDGAEVVFDDNNPDIAYVQKWCCSPGNKHIFKYTHNGTSWSSNFTDYKPSGHANNVRPMLMQGDYLYVGYQDVYKGTTPNLSWTKVSDFTNFGLTSEEHLVALDVALSDHDIMFTAFRGQSYGTTPAAHLFKTTSGGGTGANDWTDITANLPSEITRWFPITNIRIHPENPDIVWVSFGSLGKDNSGNTFFRVVKTTDGGDTWFDHSDGLTPFPVNDIVYRRGSNDEIYAATDVGVYYRDNSMNAWERYSNNLPITIVTDLEIDEELGLLTAGTYGRGIWETSLPCGQNYQTFIIDNASGDQTWSDDKVLHGNILITDGKTLTINNKALISMGENTKITVEPGSRLIIDNATLTTGCSDYWQGIIIRGNPLENQMDRNQNGLAIHQGEVIIKNGGTIRNAECAVEIADNNTPYAKGGGILKANDASFINNIVDIKMNPYRNYFVLPNQNVIDLPDRTIIRNSTLKTTNNFLGTNNEIIHMDINGIYGVRISGNVIENENVFLSRAESGTGIKASNSTIRVIDQFDIMGPKTKNTFRNLLYGIETTGWHYKGTTRIQGNDFIDVYRCIKLENSQNAEILHNNLYVADMDPNVSLATPWLASYGIYLDGGTGFRVEENDVTSDNIAPGIHGIVVSSTGAKNNEIYKNDLTDLNVGIQPQFKNRGNFDDNTKPSDGLKLFCNTFNNPSYDTWIAGKNYSGGISGIGIAKYQMTTGINEQGNFVEYPAGNVFSPNSNHPNGTPPPNPNYNDYDYSNEDAEQLTYYYWDNATDKETPYFYSNIKLKDVLDENTCPSNISSGLGDMYTDMGNAQVALNSSQLMLSIWQNGGDGDLGEEVETTEPWDVYVQFNELMAISPYVSEDVMIEVIENEAFTSLMVKLLMLANPHVINSDEVMGALYDRNPPLPQSYIDEIEGEEGELTQLDHLRADVAADYHLVRRIGENIKRTYRNDTLNDYTLDSLINFVSRQDELYDRYELAKIYLENEMFDDLNTCLSAISSEFELSDQEYESHQDYLTLFDIAEDNIQAGTGIDQLDGDQVSSLTTIAEKNRPGTSAFAVALLRNNDPEFEWYEIVLEPVEGEKSGGGDKETPNDQLTDNKVFNIYPNPAYDFITAAYDVDAQAYRQLSVVVYNSGGKKVQERPLQDFQNEVIIDLTKFSTGIYYVSLLGDGQRIATKKLNLID